MFVYQEEKERDMNEKKRGDQERKEKPKREMSKTSNP